MPDECDLGTKLGELRKRLIKSKPDALAADGILQDSITVSLQELPVDHHLDQLNLLVVLLRQLRSLADVNESLCQSLVYPQISEALQPDGALASLIIINLDHHTKANHLRAAEVLGGAAQLSLKVRPTASTSQVTFGFLDPLFRRTCAGVVTTKTSLTIISILLDCVSETGPLETVLEALLADLAETTTPSLLSSTIAALLVKKSTAEDGPSDHAILAPIIPLFAPEQPYNVNTYMMRYLLPAIFVARPSTFESSLGLLEQERSELSDQLPSMRHRFPIWVSVAAIGVGRDLTSVSALPPKRIKAAISHADPAVRLRVLELLSAGKDSVALLSTKRLDLIRESLESSAVLTNAGDRSDFTSAARAFIERLRQAENAAKRLRKKAKLKADTAGEASAVSYLDNAATFRDWLLHRYIDRGLRHARRPPVARALVALGVLSILVEVFGDLEEAKTAIFTEARVSLLLSCQASEFTEVRTKAREILQAAPKPLPGYTSLDSSRTQVLVESAYRSFASPRKTQNEAATAALSIVFETLVLPQGSNQAIAFLRTAMDRLDRALSQLERALGTASDEHGIHGLLSAIESMIRCVDLRQHDDQAAWRPVFHDLYTVVRRVWAVTKSVMSLGPTSSTDAGNEDRRDHEIARAVEVLAAGANGDDDVDGDTTRLLSDCWRATKQASELLSTIVTTPLLQADTEQVIWQKEEIDATGLQFLEWMHEIRHRGTFSRVALALASLVDAVKKNEASRPLVDKWLTLELAAIMDDSISTTRRSAALPYSVLAIVGGDEPLLDRCVNRLIELGRIDNAASSEITRVHAFNILKIVLLDTKQAKLLHKYFEVAVMTAVEAFASANWNVRNVGLILFSTLVHRVISPGRGSQDLFASRATLDSRQTFATWQSRYPRILPFVLRYVQQSSDAGGADRHTPLFPILIIVRSLRWHERAASIQADLGHAIRPLLAHHEWQIREVAAQALSALQDPSKAVDSAVGGLQEALRCSNPNAKHGMFLLIGHLIRDVVNWRNATPESIKQLESHLAEALSAPNILTRGPPMVLEAVLVASAAFAEAASSIGISPQIREIARSAVERNGADDRPGEDLLRRAAIGSLVSGSSESALLFDILTGTDDEDVQVAALERITRTANRSMDGNRLQTIMRIATNDFTPDAVRIAALHLIGTRQDRTEAERLDHGQIDPSVLFGMLQHTACVPLKEAIVPALASVLVGQPSVAMMDRLVDTIMEFSGEDQSQPSRFSAVSALQHFSPHFLPDSHSPNSCLSDRASFSIHTAILRLLQDDDEEIRLVAAEIVSQTSGEDTSLSVERAHSRWWDWAERYIPSDTPESRHRWSAWLQSVCLDQPDYQDEITQLRAHGQRPVELFEVEKPNIFRDPLDDVQRAAGVLKLLSGTTDIGSLRTTLQETVDLGDLSAYRSRCSPIEEAWGAADTLERRLPCLRMVVDATK